MDYKINGFYRYNIFLSHIWEYDNDFCSLKKLLSDAADFPHFITSIPDSKHVDPQKSIKRELIEQLCTQIEPVDIVIIISSMYKRHRDWIKFEIEIALFFGKPIIVIDTDLNGQVPDFLKNSACEIITLDSFTIIKTISKHALY